MADVSSGPIAGGEALDWIFLAMAHHRLGHAEEARKWLDKTVASIDRSAQDPPDGTSPDSRIYWKTRLYYRVLRHEAEDLIGQAGPPTRGRRRRSGRPARQIALTRGTEDVALRKSVEWPARGVPDRLGGLSRDRIPDSRRRDAREIGLDTHPES